MADHMSAVLRFRQYLDGEVDAPAWPAGFGCRTLMPGDVPEVHRLLRTAFAGDVPDYTKWWLALSHDEEFDPDLCFLAVAETGRIIGVAQCWTSSFLKDLAVDPTTRRLGLGENLLRQAFSVFRHRGAPHLDLKVDSVNSSAIRLYERVGMRQVPIRG